MRKHGSRRQDPICSSFEDTVVYIVVVALLCVNKHCLLFVSWMHYLSIRMDQNESGEVDMSAPFLPINPTSSKQPRIEAFEITIAYASLWKPEAPDPTVQGHAIVKPDEPLLMYDSQWKLRPLPMVEYHTFKGITVDEIVAQMSNLYLHDDAMYEKMHKYGLQVISGANLDETELTSLQSKGPYTLDAIAYTKKAFSSSSSYEALVDFEAFSEVFDGEREYERVYETWLELDELLHNLENGTWRRKGHYPSISDLQHAIQRAIISEPRRTHWFRYGSQPIDGPAFASLAAKHAVRRMR